MQPHFLVLVIWTDESIRLTVLILPYGALVSLMIVSETIEHDWQGYQRQDARGTYLAAPWWESVCSSKFLRNYNHRLINVARSRDRCQVYGWIGGDRPSDVLEQAKARKEQGFTAVKMNAVESVRRFLLSPVTELIVLFT